MAKVWLHIGTMKTGTTTIQEILTSNREDLNLRGYLYPVSMGNPRHVYFTLMHSGHTAPLSNFQQRMGIKSTQELTARQVELKSRFRAEVEAAAPENVIISCEELSLVMRDADTIRIMRDELLHIFDDIEVVVYIRCQIDKLISGYSTHLRFGGKRPAPFELTCAEIKIQNMEALYDRWASVFGEGAVNARVWKRGHLIDGDATADFWAQVGLSKFFPKPYPRRNTSLDIGGLSALYAYNTNPDLGKKVGRRDLVKTLDRGEFGPPFVPDPSFVADFYERHFSSTNIRLSRRLGYNEDVFSPDMDKYRAMEKAHGVTKVTYARGREVLAVLGYQ